jgi:hypothetical protein
MNEKRAHHFDEVLDFVKEFIPFQNVGCSGFQSKLCGYITWIYFKSKEIVAKIVRSYYIVQSYDNYE